MRANHFVVALILFSLLLNACSGGGSGSGGDVDDSGNSGGDGPATDSGATTVVLKATIDALVDINSYGIPISSNPGRAVVLNGRLLFSASNSAGQRGWWVSDGSEAGTELLFPAWPDQASAEGSPAPEIFGDLALIRVYEDQWWVTAGSGDSSHQIDSVPGAKLLDAYRIVDALYLVFEQGIVCYDIQARSSMLLSPGNAGFMEGTARIADSYLADSRSELIIDVRSTARAELWRVAGQNVESLLSWPLGSTEAQAFELSRFTFSDDYAAVVYQNDTTQQLELVVLDSPARQVLFSVEADEDKTIHLLPIYGDSVLFYVNQPSPPDCVVTQQCTRQHELELHLADVLTFEQGVLWTSAAYWPLLPGLFVQEAGGQLNLFLVGEERGFEFESHWYVLDLATQQLTHNASWITGGIGNSEAFYNDLVTICDDQGEELILCFVTFGVPSPDILSDQVVRKRYRSNGEFIRDEDAISVAQFEALQLQWDELEHLVFPFQQPFPLPEVYSSQMIPVLMNGIWYQSRDEWDSAGKELYRSTDIDGPFELVKDLSPAGGGLTASSNPRILDVFQGGLLLEAITDNNPYRSAFDVDPLYLSADGVLEAVSCREPTVLRDDTQGDILLYPQTTVNNTNWLRSDDAACSSTLSLFPEGMDFVYNYRDSAAPELQYVDLVTADDHRELWVTDGSKEGTYFTGLEETSGLFPFHTWLHRIYNGQAYGIYCDSVRIVDLSSLQDTVSRGPGDYCSSAWFAAEADGQLVVKVENSGPIPADVAPLELWRLSPDGEWQKLTALESAVSDFQYLDGWLYFVAEDTLWRSNLSPGGTYPVAAGLSDISKLVMIGEQVFFSACKQSEGSGLLSECMKLWRFDSKATRQTIAIEALDGLNAGVSSEIADNYLLSEKTVIGKYYPGLNEIPLVVYRQQLIFPNCTGLDDCRLWTSDGSVGGARPLLDIGVDPSQGMPSQLTLLGDTLYLVSGLQDIGNELIKISLQMVEE